MSQNVLLMLRSRYLLSLISGNSCKDTCRCINCENTKNLIRDKKNDKNDEEILADKS
jgi:hypothetical protein